MSAAQVKNVGLVAVWVNSATDVFAAGSEIANGGTSVAGVIMHYDGTAWTETVINATAALYGVWGSSASDVYCVGQSGVIVHYGPQ